MESELNHVTSWLAKSGRLLLLSPEKACAHGGILFAPCSLVISFLPLWKRPANQREKVPPQRKSRGFENHGLSGTKTRTMTRTIQLSHVFGEAIGNACAEPLQRPVPCQLAARALKATAEHWENESSGHRSLWLVCPSALRSGAQVPYQIAAELWLIFGKFGG